MKNTVSIFTQEELIEWAGENLLDTIRGYMRVQVMQTGDVLFREGETDDTLYVLINGRLQAQSDHWNLLMTEIEPGRALGETAVLTGRPHIATVSAMEPSQVIAISQKGFHQLIKRHPEIQDYFNQVITPRLHSAYLTTILQRLFGEIHVALEDVIQEQVVWRQLRSGEILYEEGAPADDLAIVVTGRLQVLTTIDGEERPIAEIAHGDMVGELALISDQPRSATVRAIRQTEIVSLNRDLFDSLIHSHPEALMNITRIIVERQQEAIGAGANRANNSLNFAVIFLDEIDLDLIDALANHISARARVFDAERFSKHFGQSRAAQASLNNYLNLLINKWLSELEIQTDYVFLVADHEWTNWTERCLQNADRVLLVANSASAPDLRPIENMIRDKFPDARQDLLLVHPPQTRRPAGTLRWLEQRQLVKHHHLRRDDEAHFARVARHLTGRAQGLVLSGGGAIGIGHIGVLRALEEHDACIDLIGGASMGALIAAGVALGKSADEMTEMAARLSDTKNILDWTIPLVSFVATRRVTKMLQELFGDARIEDLWIPYFCVSSNLSRFEPAYHHRGLLWRAVRVSTAIPVAMAPMRVGDDLHVDGSIMNNFPVDKMFELVEGGQVTGVMVSPVTTQEEHIEDLGDNVSGWRVLANRLNPFSQRLQIPSMVDTFYRSLLVNSKHHFYGVHELADTLIQIDQSEYGYLEVDKYPEFIQLGYDVARERLQAPE